MTPRLSWLLAPLAMAAALPLAAQTAPQNAPAPTQAVPPAEGAPPAAQAGQAPPPLEVSVTGGISAPMPIAIPEMPAASDVDTAAGKTGQLGRELSGIVTGDLKSSGLFNPLGPDRLRPVAYPEVTAPAFDYWGGTGAQALVQGFIRANGDGSLTVGCYLYDVLAKTELMRQGFVVRPAEWRRAAHKCADMVYTRLTGEGGYFDSRILYVAETGPKGHRVKRMAIMDQDGFNHRFLTNGQATVLNPQLSRDERRIVYMSYQGNRPQVWVYDLASGSQHPIVSTGALTFAPRFSPDGRWILFSMAQNGNTDVYKVRAEGGAPQRLTDSPGIDTGGSFSPDGSRIVFESDRSGTQQLYVMNADGSNQHRISFGSGRYATPAWSPRGDLIAFTKMAGGEFRIGVVDASGGGEHLLTDNWQDEGPSWAPNGRVITFFRSTRGGSGRSDLYSVDLTGVNERPIKTPLDGSDPFWGPLRP